MTADDSTSKLSPVTPTRSRADFIAVDDNSHVLCARGTRSNPIVVEDHIPDTTSDGTRTNPVVGELEGVEDEVDATAANPWDIAAVELGNEQTNDNDDDFQARLLQDFGDGLPAGAFDVAENGTDDDPPFLNPHCTSSSHFDRGCSCYTGPGDMFPFDLPYRTDLPPSMQGLFPPNLDCTPMSPPPDEIPSPKIVHYFDGVDPNFEGMVDGGWREPKRHWEGGKDAVADDSSATDGAAISTQELGQDDTGLTPELAMWKQSLANEFEAMEKKLVAELAEKAAKLEAEFKAKETELTSDHAKKSSKLDHDRSVLAFERTEVEASRLSVDADLKVLDTERSHLNDEMEALDNDREDLLKGQKELAADCEAMTAERKILEADRKALGGNRKTLDEVRKEMNEKSSIFEAKEKQRVVDLAALQELEAVLNLRKKDADALTETLYLERKVLVEKGNQLDKKAKELNEEQTRIDKHMEACKAEVEELNATRDKCKEKIQQCTLEIEEHANQMVAQKAKIAELNTEIESKTLNVVKLLSCQELANGQRELQEAEKEFQKAQEVLKSGQNCLDLDLVKLKRDQQALQRRAKVLEQDQNQLKKGRIQLEDDRNTFYADQDVLEREQIELEAAQQKLADDRTQLNDDRELMTSERTAMSDRRAEQEAENQDLSARKIALDRLEAELISREAKVKDDAARAMERQKELVSAETARQRRIQQDINAKSKSLDEQEESIVAREKALAKKKERDARRDAQFESRERELSSREAIVASKEARVGWQKERNAFESNATIDLGDAARYYGGKADVQDEWSCGVNPAPAERRRAVPALQSSTPLPSVEPLRRAPVKPHTKATPRVRAGVSLTGSNVHMPDLEKLDRSTRPTRAATRRTVSPGLSSVSTRNEKFDKYERRAGRHTTHQVGSESYNSDEWNS